MSANPATSPFHVPEQFRLTAGPMRSTPADGNNGYFAVPWQPSQLYAMRGVETILLCIASDCSAFDADYEKFKHLKRWEHVSVHVALISRALNKEIEATPTWEQMHAIKCLFWGEESVVMQLHPRQSEYVNHHPHTLHLWRPVEGTIPTPPLEFV